MKKPASAFWAFLGYASLFVIFGFVLRVGWEILWTDVFNTNPHRTLTHALIVLPLMSAIVGIWVVIGTLSGSLIAASAIASFASRNRRPNLWLLIVLVPLSAIIVFLQDTLVPTYHLYSATPDDIEARKSAWATVILTAHLLPGLIAGWLRLRFVR